MALLSANQRPGLWTGHAYGLCRSRCSHRPRLGPREQLITYSYLKATIGSTFAARRAGM
jgi:hypothetical protein